MKNESWFGFLFSSSGRVSRKRYWLSYVWPLIMTLAVAAVLDVIVSETSEKPSSIFKLLACLFFLWPGFAVAAKRLHDVGTGGWWAIPANGLTPAIVLTIATSKMRTAKVTTDTPDATAATLGIVGIILALVWLYFAVQLAFLRGQVGENKYGDDPLPTPADVRSDRYVTVANGTLWALIFVVLPVSAYWYYTNKMTKLAPSDGIAGYGEAQSSEPTGTSPEELGLIPMDDDRPSGEGGDNQSQPESAPSGPSQ